jgi:hypothetical protein
MTSDKFHERFVATVLEQSNAAAENGYTFDSADAQAADMFVYSDELQKLLIEYVTTILSENKK